ncbi:MAG: sigma 54-interacting transcriptional regulator [Deltaproteobacteria bacterium]|nr:sigma 54-interacting transcriptional regulator [Deltaproteobacteria bacterium]
MGETLLNGRYLVEKRVGQGAQGVSFLARDTARHDTRVVIKVYYRARVSDRAAWEFGQLSRLKHEGIVRVHELSVLTEAEGGRLEGLEAGQSFVVQEWIDGIASTRFVDSGDGLQIERLGRLLLSVSESLAYLHERRLLHRDIKPSHILVRGSGGWPDTCLIDFGLSLPVGDRKAGLTGTPGYIAPECLTGMYTPATDLYSLGAAAYKLATGSPPVRFRGGATPRQVVESILGVRVVPCGERSPDLPPWLAEAVDRLMAPDPADRFPSARALGDHLRRHVRGARRVRSTSTRSPHVAMPPLRGRRSLVNGLVEAGMRRLVAGRRGSEAVVLLEGPRGIGKSAVISEFKRRLLLRHAAEGRDFPRFLEGGVRDLATFASAQVDDVDPALSSWLVGDAPPPVDAIVRLIADPGLVSTGLVVVLRTLDALSVKVVAGLAGRLLRDDPAVPLLVVGERDTDVEGGAAAVLGGLEGVRVERLEPLGDHHVASVARFVLGESAGDEQVDLVVSRSGGNPLYALELAAHLAVAGPADAGLPASLEDLVRQSVGGVSADQRSVLVALGLRPGGMALALLSAVLDRPKREVFGDVQALRERGWVEAAGEILRPGSMAAEVAARAVPARDLGRLHGRLGDALASLDDVPAWEAAFERLLAGRVSESLDEVLDGSRRLAAGGEPARAVPLLEEAIGRLRGRRRTLAGLDLARLYRETGRYEEALALLDDLPRSAGSQRQLERARTLRLCGRPAAAEPLLEELASGDAASSLEGVEALALLARMLVDRGDPDRAIELLSLRDIEALDEELRFKLLEPLGMALAGVGRGAEALETFRSAAELAGKAGGPLVAARFHIQSGKILQEQGVFGQALEDYEKALELARRGGDAHAQAGCALNVGAILLERGRCSEAMGKLTGALRKLQELGEVRELPVVLFNLANLRARIGDPDGALEHAERGRALARRQGQDVLLPYFWMIEGNVARQRGDLAAALALLDDAFAECERGGDQAGRLTARRLGAEACSMLGSDQEARSRIDATRTEPAFEKDSPAADWLALASARVASPRGGDRDEALGELRRARRAFAARGELEGELRASILLLKLAGARADRSGGARLRETIRKLAGVLRRNASALGYDPLRVDAELRAIERMQYMRIPDGDSSTGSMPSQPSSTGADNKWKRLARINKRLNSEIRLKPLLETILDTLLDLTGATRGFILIRGAEDAFKVKAARNIDEAGLPGGKRDFSSSIVQEVVESGRPLITIDAASDERFDALRSVHDLDLKSVLCVPLLERGKVTGAVYVDNPYSSAIFGGEDVELVMDFADQAAIALENARLMAENRRRELRIDRLNRKLERALKRQQIELRGLRETIDRSLPPDGGTERRYVEIVGDSEPMKKLFHLLDRIIDSDLPAVVVGESGTGKELVARAIHFCGPRKRGPFVTENCGAIPDTLLESVLFGHRKGAFTGADRDRPGLFEVASGGTLFLDEIASMTQTMQTKLLRTLQEGVIRPLGGSAERKVDVRIIAALNRNLASLVREGSFREDLYYRMNVVSVEVPPLRDRREDIPSLVAHFIEKHAAGRKVELEPEVLARLMAYDWPGNVRELENEIMRALVLGGDVIEADLVLPDRDLDAIRPADSARADLDLKGQMERLERSLIGKALRRSGGNQSASARLLGISRYGLIKKMRRLGIG